MDRRGFTIIEVVVVLAIAGLIFSIVFWALPNLRKNQRDIARRTHLFHVIAEMDNFRSLTGRAPVTRNDVESFNDFFLANSEYQDPLAGPYDIRGIVEDTTGGHREYPQKLGDLYYKARHFCAEGPYIEGRTDIIQHRTESYSTAAVWTKGENVDFLCVDNGSERPD